MKIIFKIISTILLFFFSLFYLNKATTFIKMNDQLMQEIKNKEIDYNIKATDAIITDNTMIPGISGKEINLDESFLKMKKINKFNESLLVFNSIKPKVSVEGIYDKVIINGNNNKKRISIILNINNKNLFNNLNTLMEDHNIYTDILTNDNYNLSNTHFKNIITTNHQYQTNYCLTYNLTISNECIQNHKHTILGYSINNNYLSETKEELKNGIILVYTFNEYNYYDLNTIIKYLKNNQYNIVPVNELIKE